jgi:hypothetical protein
LETSNAVLFDPITNFTVQSYLASPYGFPDASDVCTDCVNRTLTLLANEYLPMEFSNETTVSIMAPVNVAFGNTCQVIVERNVTIPNNKTALANVSISYGGEATLVGPSIRCQDSWNSFRRSLRQCTLPLEKLYTTANPAQETWSGSFDYSPTPDQTSVQIVPTTTADDIARFLAPFSYLNLTLLDYAVPLLCSTLGSCDNSTNLTAHYNSVWKYCEPTAKKQDRLSTMLLNKAITLYGDITSVTCYHEADIADPKNVSDFCFPDFAENIQALQNILTPINIFPQMGTPIEETRSPLPRIAKDSIPPVVAGPSGPAIDPMSIDPWPPASWRTPTLNSTRFCGPCQSVLLQNFVSILNVTSTNPNEVQFISGEAEGIRRYVCGGRTDGLEGYNKIRACAAGRSSTLLHGFHP